MYLHMGKSRKQPVTLLPVLLVFCACAFALDPSLDISQYAHTSWKVRDGFTKGENWSIAQTPDGYLWLGTEFGLYRFDGVRAVSWQPPTGKLLPSDTIGHLLAARDGTLWIGTLRGLASWKDGMLTTYPELSGEQVWSVLEDREGTIWAGSIVAQPPSGKLCAIRSRDVQCFGGDGSLAYGVIALYEDSKGTLWASGFTGFWRWKPGPPKFFSMPGNVNGIRAFAEDEQGALLFGTQTGIKRLVGERAEPYAIEGSPQQSQIEALLRDRDGGLWVGTSERGLIHVHRGKADTFTESDGLSGGSVNGLFEDREGNIWAIAIGGLDRFRGYNVPTISLKQGLSNSRTGAVLAANDGAVWVSTLSGLNRWKNGQISVFGRQTGMRKPDGKLNGQNPGSLFQDSSGRIWVSTNREFGYLKNDRFIPIPGYPGGWVHSIVEAPAGHLWVSVQWAGLFHIYQEKIVQQISWGDLGHKDDAKLAVDPSQHGLWLGFFQGGVAYLADGRIQKSYSAADGLGQGRVNQLRFGPRGALWAATEGGLSRIKDGHISTLTSKNGLPCDAIHWTMPDDDNSVWLLTACGLVRIARSELDGWAADPARRVKIAVFDISDGVESHSYASSYVSQVTKSPDGRIWFVPRDGVSVIDPHHLAFNKLAPPVHIEKIVADDKTYDEPGNGVRLATGVRYLTIDYTALSLVAPEKVHFRYKLEGQDKDWREVVNDREVQYSNLAPKRYRFRVLASNNSGVWNEEGAAVEFVIPPAWYQTNWFRAACVAAFLAMMWGVYELRVRQLAAEFNVRLEERVAERTRIARDLHDTLLQSFQGLLPLFQVGIKKLPEGAVDSRKTLQLALDRASEAIGEGRDAIKGLRMSTTEKNDLAMAIRTIGEEFAAGEDGQNSISFQLLVEGTPRELHPILRDEIYRLATEALRNSFRHADAKNVEVEIRYDEKYFRLRVRDDGKGIPSDVLSRDGREGHYGLPGMRERAKLVGGKLTIWTELDSGTEIELVIPGARAYVKSARPFWYFGKRSATETDEKESIERE